MIFIDHFNPSFYFQFKSPNYLEIIDQLYSENEKVSPTHKWADNCRVIPTNLKVEKYKKYIDLWMEEVIGFYKVDVAYKIDNLWMNTYEFGGFQESHDHSNSDLVFVFFANTGENFAEFYFKNRFNVNLSRELRKTIDDYTSESFSPSVDVGTVLAFPSTLSHGVDPHKSTIKRKTLACNVSIMNL